MRLRSRCIRATGSRETCRPALGRRAASTGPARAFVWSRSSFPTRPTSRISRRPGYPRVRRNGARFNTALTRVAPHKPHSPCIAPAPSNHHFPSTSGNSFCRLPSGEASLKPLRRAMSRSRRSAGNLAPARCYRPPGPGPRFFGCAVTGCRLPSRSCLYLVHAHEKHASPGHSIAAMLPSGQRLTFSGRDGDDGDGTCTSRVGLGPGGLPFEGYFPEFP